MNKKGFNCQVFTRKVVLLDVNRDFKLTFAVVCKSKIKFLRVLWIYQSFANPFLFTEKDFCEIENIK